MTIRDFPAIDGIHSIVLPLTGFGDLLTSNIFVLGNGPVTLIDTGPKFPGSFNTLKSGLNSAGFDFPDVERIIITHGHIDHFGMAALIIREAGHPVSCFIHGDDIWRTKADYIMKGLWGEEVMDFIRMAGMPDLAVERMKRRSAFFKHFCDPLEQTLPMQDGDTFTG
ncbi:MBL fold metallo-hydrolase, partial [archaeon]|nr:MBL fold metallo-hydrolase [archaeon]